MADGGRLKSENAILDEELLREIPWHFCPDLNPVLYHYTSTEAARAIVNSGNIWLSEFSAMNDSSEFHFARECLLNLIRNREVEIEEVPRWTIALALESMARGTNLTICSLTAEGDNLGQWRSYADNGRGCVLTIDASYLVHNAGVAVRKIVYDPAVVKVALCAVLSVIQQQFEECPEDIDTLMDFARRAVSDLFNVKHPAFTDEREVRIARMLVWDENKELIDPGGYRTDGRQLVPLEVETRHGAFGPTNFVQLPLVQRDGNSAIIGIRLGPSMSDCDRSLNKKYFEGRGLIVTNSEIPYRC